jgi:glyoxylase-like metal-dependent hydrolase (beta-lactamase superfamily II)
MLAESVRWHDDWFALEEIAEGVTAIGEPRFHQNNWSYLIRGERRALLFDTGTGVRDMARLVRNLTSLPVTALPSHLHYDHTGGLWGFPTIAMADLPVLRAMERDGWFHASDELFLGRKAGMVWRPVRVSNWLAPGAAIDLGGRRLDLVPTPGHSPDSVSLHESRTKLFFAADFIYPGQLYAQVPGSDLAAYLATARALGQCLTDESRILCAHGETATNGSHRALAMARSDLVDLADRLEVLRQSGARPAQWAINGRMMLLASPAAYGAWQSL